jgi:hypothetical protein
MEQNLSFSWKNHDYLRYSHLDHLKPLSLGSVPGGRNCLRLSKCRNIKRRNISNNHYFWWKWEILLHFFCFLIQFGRVYGFSVRFGRVWGFVFLVWFLGFGVLVFWYDF